MYRQYQVAERIAVGGMAEIYRGIAGSQGVERPVVIKKVHPRYSTDRRFIRMLINEAKITAYLSHPNIVRIIDLGRSDQGEYFIVMEYVEGRDLRALVERFKRRKQPLDLDMLLFVIAEICDALEHAHHLTDPEGRPLNLIHRDVSPSNILISYAGEIKLADFGVARFGRDASMVGSLKGKLAYMSPEQARAEQIDHRSDIFSLGAVLFELVMGRRVFQESSDLAMLRAVREAQVPRAGDIDPKIPPALDKILQRALARSPGDRFQSVEELSTALRSFRFAHCSGQFGSSELSRLMHRLFGAPEQRPPVSKMPRFTIATIAPFGDEAESGTSVERPAQRAKQNRMRRGRDGADEYFSEVRTEPGAPTPEVLDQLRDEAGGENGAHNGRARHERAIHSPEEKAAAQLLAALAGDADPRWQDYDRTEESELLFDSATTESADQHAKRSNGEGRPMRSPGVTRGKTGRPARLRRAVAKPSPVKRAEAHDTARSTASPVHDPPTEKEADKRLTRQEVDHDAADHTVPDARRASPANAAAVAPVNVPPATAQSTAERPAAATLLDSENSSADDVLDGPWTPASWETGQFVAVNSSGETTQPEDTSGRHARPAAAQLPAADDSTKPAETSASAELRPTEERDGQPAERSDEPPVSSAKLRTSEPELPAQIPAEAVPQPMSSESRSRMLRSFSSQWPKGSRRRFGLLLMIPAGLAIGVSLAYVLVSRGILSGWFGTDTTAEVSSRQLATSTSPSSPQLDASAADAGAAHATTARPQAPQDRRADLPGKKRAARTKRAKSVARRKTRGGRARLRTATKAPTKTASKTTEAEVRRPGRATAARGGDSSPAAGPRRAVLTKKTTRSPKAPGTGKGRVVIKSEPWAYVIVDGVKSSRTTSSRPFELSSGKHTVELVNPALNIKKRFTIEVEAGQTLKRFVALQ